MASDRSRNSLLNALKTGGRRSAEDRYDDGLFGTTHPMVYKSRYDSLRKKLIPGLRMRMEALKARQEVFEGLTYKELVPADDGEREKVLERARKIAAQKERERFMNDRYLRLWKSMREIVPKYDERKPCGQWLLDGLSVARMEVILRALALLDESLLLRKGGTCRHGRRCCKVGHFVGTKKGIDVGDMYLREVQEGGRANEEKLDMITMTLDAMTASLQSVDHVAAERLEAAMKLIEGDEARGLRKVRSFNKPIEFRPTKKTKRVLSDSDDDSDGEGAALFGAKSTEEEVEEREAKELKAKARRGMPRRVPVVVVVDGEDGGGGGDGVRTDRAERSAVVESNFREAPAFRPPTALQATNGHKRRLEEPTAVPLTVIVPARKVRKISVPKPGWYEKYVSRRSQSSRRSGKSQALDNAVDAGGVLAPTSSLFEKELSLHKESLLEKLLDRDRQPFAIVGNMVETQ